MHSSLANAGFDVDAGFWAEERRRTPVPVRVACLLGIMSFGAFYFLDPFVAGDVETLFAARTIIIAVHLALLAFSFTQLARRHFRVLALLPCFAIGLGVVTVTWLAGGGTSRYHEALLLLFLGYPLVVPTRPLSAGLSFASVTMVYGALMVAKGVTGPAAVWMTNNFVLWAAVVIATAGVSLAYRRRRREYEARVTIARTSEALASALEQTEHEKEQSEALHNRITTMRQERMRWLENLARFLRHELKNQAVAIGTSLRMTRETTLDRRAELYVDRASQSLGRMKRLVDSATEATSLEAALAIEEMEAVDLTSLVRERATVFRHAYPERRLMPVIEANVYVEGNEDRLVQLLDKLLENAVQHTYPGGEIRILLKREHGCALLSIENNGDALPSNREALFDAFVTMASPAEEGQNLGLGLFVAKAIAESHGGTVTARDRQRGRGACFEVRLHAR